MDCCLGSFCWVVFSWFGLLSWTHGRSGRGVVSSKFFSNGCDQREWRIHPPSQAYRGSN